MGKFDSDIVEARKALAVIDEVQTRVVRRHHIANAVAQLRREIDQLVVERQRTHESLRKLRSVPEPEMDYISIDAVQDRARKIEASMTARTERIRSLVEEDTMIKSRVPGMKRDIESAKDYLLRMFERLVDVARRGSSEARRALRKVDWAAGGLNLPADLR